MNAPLALNGLHIVKKEKRFLISLAASVSRFFTEGKIYLKTFSNLRARALKNLHINFFVVLQSVVGLELNFIMA